MPIEPLLECEVWSECPGALTNQIAPTKNVPGQFQPGDSVEVAIIIDNRANIASDSLEIIYQGPAFEGWDALVPVNLEAGQQLIVRDTLVFKRYNFGAEGVIDVDVIEYRTWQPVSAVITGETLPVAPSGYALELLTPPSPTIVFEHNGNTYSGSRLKVQSPTAANVRISNPYDVPIVDMPLGMCVWLNDDCFQQFDKVIAGTIAPGTSRDAVFDFALQPDTYFEWFRERVFFLTLCGEDGFLGKECQVLPVLVGASYADHCGVGVIAPDTVVTDDEADCPDPFDPGSAYSFTAEAGARYRVSMVTGDGDVFFSPEHGVRAQTLPTEFNAVAGGTHYVIVLHHEPVSFRLERLTE